MLVRTLNAKSFLLVVLLAIFRSAVVSGFRVRSFLETPKFSGGLLDGLPSYVPSDPFSGSVLTNGGRPAEREIRALRSQRTTPKQPSYLLGVPGSCTIRDPFAELPLIDAGEDKKR